jgi:HEAT repeat protein
LVSGCISGQPRPPASDDDRDLGRRAQDLLIRAVQSDDPVVRANAIEALVHVAPNEGLPYFRASIDDGAPLVRFAACMAIGEIQDTASRSAVTRRLKDEKPRVRLAAAYAGYRLGDQQLASLLVEALGDHPDEDMRCDAAFLIGKCGDARAMRRLKLMEQRERGPKAIMHIKAAMAALGNRAAQDDIIRTSLESEPVAKLLALQTMVELRSPAVGEALRYRLSQEGDYLEARLLAARGLGRLGSAVGYDLAIDSLRHRDKEQVDTMRVRSLAALALGAIGDSRALAELARTAENESDARTQVAACYAICEILAKN